jgi:hypothetical protein
MSQEKVRVVRLKDGQVLVYVPVEDVLAHIEEMLARKVRLLQWVIQKWDAMPADTKRRYLEDVAEELERLRLVAHLKALVYDEFTWAWLSYAWAISGRTVEEVVDRFRSLAELGKELDEKGYAVIAPASEK